MPPTRGRAVPACPPAGAGAAQGIDARLAVKAITGTGALADPHTLATHRRLFVSAALVGASADPAPPARLAAGIARWLAASPGARMIPNRIVRRLTELIVGPDPCGAS